MVDAMWVRTAVGPGHGGIPIRTAADLATWVTAHTTGELADPLAFVIDAEGSCCRLRAEASTWPARAGSRCWAPAR